MKKILALVLTLTMIVALAAVGGTASAAGPTYTITAALHTTAGGIEELTVQRFGELLSEATNGDVVVETYGGAALGTEAENLTQIKSGEVEFVLFGDVFLSQLLQDYNATSIPFVFGDIDSAVGYWESISDTVDQICKDEGGMYIVGRQYRAPRQLTASKAIETPADLKGVKLRVPETTFYLKVWGGLGAITTPVNWSEVFTALQTHVVDAQENPIETYYAAGLCEVQSHTMLTSL